mmetsp:Transcript_13547/g.44234  ORF Transcript_13547/g.44234 Transcript_13547/m.44234 type:complete len:362 (+) Transcript_13547:217-1302(+)
MLALALTSSYGTNRLDRSLETIWRRGIESARARVRRMCAVCCERERVSERERDARRLLYLAPVRRAATATAIHRASRLSYSSALSPAELPGRAASPTPNLLEQRTVNSICSQGGLSIAPRCRPAPPCAVRVRTPNPHYASSSAINTCPVALSRVRRCTLYFLPSRMASTASAALVITSHSSCLPRRNSMITSKMGGPPRFVTTLLLITASASPKPRLLAWTAACASPRVTCSRPPIRPRSALFCTSLRRSPCAEATIRTPRALQVRAASTSSVRPISSITITSGVWFCTPSTITWPCSLREWTCIRRACPTHGWGTSPSPAISFDVSTISTLHRSASTRAASRTTVVLPLIRTERERVSGE